MRCVAEDCDYLEKPSVLKEEIGISDDSEAIRHLIAGYAESLDEV